MRDEMNMDDTPAEDGREVPEVIAHLVLGGIFDSTELGDIDYLIEPDIAERLQLDLVKATNDVHVPLMAVSQHKRIVAEVRADHARIQAELLKRIESLTAQPARPVGDELKTRAAEYIRARRKSAELEYLCAAELEDDGDADESAACAHIAKQHEEAADLVEELIGAAIAPAAVVILPEYDSPELHSPGSVNQAFAMGVNNALDEVTRLNANPLPLAELEALCKAFTTGESADGQFRVVMKFATLADMQAGHNALVRLTASLAQQQEGDE